MYQRMDASLSYLAAGGNRHPSAADWDSNSGLLAYGAGNNLALWYPQDTGNSGIKAILKGHTDTVNAVKFLSCSETKLILLSGSADTTLRVWHVSKEEPLSFQHVQRLKGHTGSINCIATLTDSNIVVTGAVDCTLMIWRIQHTAGQLNGELIQTLELHPRYLPLCIALYRHVSSGCLILAVGGTRSLVQIFAAESIDETMRFVYETTLPGHEGWVRSLDFTTDGHAGKSPVFLASASQDKSIRLWHLHEPVDTDSEASHEHHSSGLEDPTLLSNRAYTFSIGILLFSLTFEALLLGHEDWIYNVRWCPTGGCLQLLSASADNSLAMWQAETESGVWVCANRLGEISAQKGSTTATGSSGGFWNCLWSPDGGSVVSVSRTGGWRQWEKDTRSNIWHEKLGVGGHIKDVRGLDWSKSGTYLLSSSADQTTRLHAPWHRSKVSTWHEMSRPQIHGYDINCVGAISDSQFISGAEEKLLRVFDEPRQVAQLFHKLNGGESVSNDHLPDTASMPVLGLSNKTVQPGASEDSLNPDDGTAPIDHEGMYASVIDTSLPPFEDVLSKHSLWPEHEKLYGHGYEISALACSHDASLVATTCKASSVEHAAIRLYRSDQWREIRPSLEAHSLTVTAMDFSDDDEMLLSVGRDRQWSVFVRNARGSFQYQMLCSNRKAHSRMLLGASWAPSKAGRVFATASRDKTVKLWARFTAVAFEKTMQKGNYVLALGQEDGGICVHIATTQNLNVTASLVVDTHLCPALTVTQLRWRPEWSHEGLETKGCLQHDQGLLAVASDDHSIRIMALKLENAF